MFFLENINFKAQQYTKKRSNEAINLVDICYKLNVTHTWSIHTLSSHSFFVHNKTSFFLIISGDFIFGAGATVVDSINIKNSSFFSWS